MYNKLSVLVVFLILLVAGRAAAETLKLSTGQVIRGKILSSTGNTFTIETDDGTIEIEKDSVKSITFEKYIPKQNFNKRDDVVIPAVERQQVDQINSQPREKNNQREVDRVEMHGIWPYKLSDIEYKLVVDAGCRFTEREKDIARRLFARKIPRDVYVKSYITLDWLNIDGLATVSAEGAGSVSYLELMTVYMLLNLPPHQFSYFKSTGQSLTQYYNGYLTGGKGHLIGGGVLVGISAIAWIIGAQNDKNGNYGPAASAFVTGVITGIAGIATASVGIHRARKWVREGLLENGSLAEIYEATMNGYYVSPGSNWDPNYPVYEVDKMLRESNNLNMKFDGGGIALEF